VRFSSVYRTVNGYGALVFARELSPGYLTTARAEVKGRRQRQGTAPRSGCAVSEWRGQPVVAALRRVSSRRRDRIDGYLNRVGHTVRPQLRGWTTHWVVAVSAVIYCAAQEGPVKVLALAAFSAGLSALLVK